MIVLPAILIKTVKHTRHLVREIAFDDMARQASGWIPDDARIEKQTCSTPPIKLNFDIPRKNRLGWIRRTLHYYPR
jgi:hypothetical protein